MEKDEINTPRVPIWYSNEFNRTNLKLNKDRKCVLLIPSGPMGRNGIWNRDICVKDSFAMGSMLPYIDACRRLRIGVFVMNPNINKCPKTNIPIIKSTSADEHVLTVWQNYLIGCGFSDVYIVAHGTGGETVAAI